MKPGWYGFRLTRTREQHLNEIRERENLGGPGELTKVIDFCMAFYLLTARSEAISPSYLADAADASRQMAASDRAADRLRVIPFRAAEDISEHRKYASHERLRRTGTDDGEGRLPF